MVVPTKVRSNGKTALFDQTARNRSWGYNWVEGLSELCSAINRQRGSWLSDSLFCIIRKKNRLSETAEEIGTLAQTAFARCAKKTSFQRMRKKSCLVRKKRWQILVTVYTFRSHVYWKRHLLPGKIVRRRVWPIFFTFKKPEGSLIRQWVIVEHITSRTLAKRNTEEICRLFHEFRNKQTTSRKELHCQRQSTQQWLCIRSCNQKRWVHFRHRQTLKENILSK